MLRSLQRSCIRSVAHSRSLLSPPCCPLRSYHTTTVACTSVATATAATAPPTTCTTTSTPSSSSSSSSNDPIALIHQHIDAGRISDATTLLSTLPPPTTLETWDLHIRVRSWEISQSQTPNDASIRAMIQQMKQVGFIPQASTYFSILSALAHRPHPSLLMSWYHRFCLAQTSTSGYEIHVNGILACMLDAMHRTRDGQAIQALSHDVRGWIEKRPRVTIDDKTSTTTVRDTSTIIPSPFVCSLIMRIYCDVNDLAALSHVMTWPDLMTTHAIPLDVSVYDTVLHAALSLALLTTTPVHGRSMNPSIAYVSSSHLYAQTITSKLSLPARANFNFVATSLVGMIWSRDWTTYAKEHHIIDRAIDACIKQTVPVTSWTQRQIELEANLYAYMIEQMVRQQHQAAKKGKDANKPSQEDATSTSTSTSSSSSSPSSSPSTSTSTTESSLPFKQWAHEWHKRYQRHHAKHTSKPALDRITRMMRISDTLP